MHKKVCFVLPVHSSFTMGGSQYQVEMLIEYLQRNHSIEIVYLTNSCGQESEHCKYHVEKIRSRFSKLKSLNLISSSWNLYSALKEFDPDIVYQRIACYQTLICAYYAQKYNKKMVWHVSSDADVTPLTFKITRNFISRIIEKKMVELGLMKVKKIVAQTNYQSKLIFKNYGRNTDAVIRNFNDCPNGVKPKKKNIQVVWIANLKQFKQPELFIQLAKELHPITGATFLMAGKQQGPARWWKKLQDRIISTEGLKFLGVLTQDDVNRLLEESHISINTSQIEGFSNVFIQAWMRKVPVISLIVNPDELLTEMKIGFCSRTYQNLKRDTLKLIKDSDLRQQMGEAAYEYSLKHHSKKNIEEIHNLIETSE